LRPTLLLRAAVGALPATALAAAPSPPALLRSEPFQGEVRSNPPPAVRLRFDQPVRLDRLRVFDDAGAELVVRRMRDTAPALEQRGGLSGLRPGEYRAEWSATSPAGQSVSGVLVFRVAEPPRRGRGGATTTARAGGGRWLPHA
jgi:methionine-rich copper-binding protein CopC